MVYTEDAETSTVGHSNYPTESVVGTAPPECQFDSDDSDLEFPPKRA